MARTVAGVLAGFFSWMMLWFAGETLLSLIGPDWCGAPQRAPLVLACLLLAMGLAKAAMSWQMVPLWYHVAFTALLPALAIVGGKLAARAAP
jgi:hypothetical protein